ncbi:hypothetical protein ASE75_08060 [Sphingomonas sp. Leaf17]|uniref:TadE/TadG family type IV pilus assembly protein n=1 Tax=Sphingomonas sp. Leaf17 TaxID=1735683 RepID=UPI0006F25CC5|nr:hypothetical protein [Sphingomonas sp. Leaf17]KQM65000.1 hypothetical protein ASE75_08060 [Sphingomonas sp. Leaf17]
MTPALHHRLRRALRRFARETRGVALVEFAFAAPIVLGIGTYAVELANYGITQMRVSQIALNLADNASRVGATSSLSIQQLREGDINDVLQAARYQGSRIGLTTTGRITLSSLEQNSSGGQWIHWQRCIGLKRGVGYDSSYGTEGDGASGTGFAGMGETGAKVTAPPASGVMFVEINYDYQPVFGNWVLGTKKIRYIASFIVRDNRDFGQIHNPAPAAAASSCSLYTA